MFPRSFRYANALSSKQLSDDLMSSEQVFFMIKVGHKKREGKMLLKGCSDGLDVSKGMHFFVSEEEKAILF